MKAKSQILRSILKNLNYALFATKNGDLEYNKIQELSYEYNKSRRDFIVKTSQATVVLGIASMFPFSSCISTKKKQPVIAIIGGGIAGLNCAYVLEKQGFTAQIYEADKRIGGRIYTQKDVLGEGITTELGGEFIDSTNEDMLNLIKEFQLEPLLDVQEDCEKNNLIKETYFFNNKHFTEEEVFNEFKKIAKKIEDDKNSCGANTDSPAAKTLDNTNLEKYIRSLNCANWLQDILLVAYTSEYGLDASEQSCLNFITFIGTETEDNKDGKAEFKMYGTSDERYKIKGGNGKIIEALEAKLKDQIFTSYQLTSISSNTEKTTLKFTNDKEIIADYVVLTLPYSVLRNIEMKIDQITPDKLNCIKLIGYGQNNKILLGFNNRPWRENKLKYSGYLFNPLINNGWDNSQMQNENKGQGGYTIFLGGKQSIDLANNAKINNSKNAIPESEIQKYIEELDKAFPGVKSNYSGKNKVVFWSNNPFTNGSYSCFKVGQWTTIAAKIFEPVGNVHFAGEHTSVNFQGFMNGGAETGRRAAEDILKKLNKPVVFRKKNHLEIINQEA